MVGFLVLMAAFRAGAAGPAATFATDTAQFVVSAEGNWASVTSAGSGAPVLAPGQPAPILSLRVAGTWHAPVAAEWDDVRGRLTLRYSAVDGRAVLEVRPKSTHLTLELVEAGVAAPAEIEAVLWGPYPTVIGETIGEIVGVVRNREVAFGIQALNAKTLGGYPAAENDADVDYGGDDRGYYPDLPAELRIGQGFRGDAARSAPFGSVLQAYCRNRTQTRVLPNWGHERYRVLPYPDRGVIGSRIALFVCPEPRALAVIGAIEEAEGLPHPMLDGEWAKTSRNATASYLIVDFGEATIDRAIEMTRRAGLKYLYHSSPFATWGHFQLKPALFPNGWAGFRACVEKAAHAGIRLGFHTLSNFITPSDAYVTPRPDPRLAVIGDAALVDPADAGATELSVADPEYFKRKSALNTVRIGDELIRFESVSDGAPWRLLKCRRGAWGTVPAAHASGDRVSRLLDHDYKVFLGDADLSQEIARNIAAFCNQTGARQLSFDGLEGNWSTGYGQYGRTLFTQAWYDALAPAARGKVLNDASNPGHYNWHINTRMNWGEPWYAGFRESQTLYRFKNQVLFERNFMPHMLGWFALRPDTSLEDAEWLLARAAGFQAGFALATSLASTAQLEADPASADTSRQFGATTAILATIGTWERARMAGAFPAEVRAKLRDNGREFQLRSVVEDRWELQEVFGTRFAVTNGAALPVEADFNNPADAQALQWILRSTSKEPLGGLTLMVNGNSVVSLKGNSLPPGGALRYSGGVDAVIMDSTWHEVARVPVAGDTIRVPDGVSKIQVSAALPADSSLKVELRTLGAVTRLTKP